MGCLTVHLNKDLNDMSLGIMMEELCNGANGQFIRGGLSGLGVS